MAPTPSGWGTLSAMLEAPADTGQYGLLMISAIHIAMDNTIGAVGDACSACSKPKLLFVWVIHENEET